MKKNSRDFKKGHIPWNKGLGTKKVICKNCDKPFLVQKAKREKENKGKFCSWDCRWNYKYKLANNIKFAIFASITLPKDKRGYSWITNLINLEGPHNLKKWLKLIGFKNPRIITRYKYLQKQGYLPPKTTLPERMNILNWQEVMFK